ncbi:MAG: hypothetical protein RXR82_06045 [Nitrososphaeria archaeon]
MSAVVFIPVAVVIHFPNGEKKSYSRRYWNWDVDRNEIELWRKDMTMKLRYSGNIVIETIYAPERKREEDKDAGSGA